MIHRIVVIVGAAHLLFLGPLAANDDPLAEEDLVFEEVDGVLAVEAEHHFKQTLTSVRRWHLTTAKRTPKVEPDGDPNHVTGASGGAYLEALPDTRRSHGDKLISGQNFDNTPGRMAVLHYKVHFNTPGRYYVWSRVYSTNTEDNSLHVGLDGMWPPSGQRMQWTRKREWIWDSKQRTAKVHVGVKHNLYLDVEKPGEHVVSFAMREDGVEFDKWVMVREKRDGIDGVGPVPRVKRGTLPAAIAVPVAAVPAAVPSEPRGQDGDGTVRISGELKVWHKVTLTLDGPFASETGNPNPFLDYRMEVTFKRGALSYVVPGYFAADGKAANTSAKSGTKWRAHLSPDSAGKWSYTVSFMKGDGVAVNGGGRKAAPWHGKTGTFGVGVTDKSGRDFRGKGRLQYVGGHFLKHAGNGEYFLKQGADAPENLLAYADFDGPFKTDGQKDKLIKDWAPHVRDWNNGDPTWQNGKGKGLIGAINYLAGEGMNVFSFLPLNVGGDDRNVFPYLDYDERERMDVSRLDQWEIVFEHGTRKGMYLHFKTLETENELLLDKGDLGPQRKLYYRELIARFSHHLAMNWNLGEEINNATTAQKKSWAQYFFDTDPYHHLIVIHNGANHYDLLGDASKLTGFSLQTNKPDFSKVHSRVLEYLRRSVKAGKPWVVACDEPGDASHSLRPDADAGTSQIDGRKNGLWGTLMAGGAGNEWYFGYKHAHSDLTLNDFRSRDKWWDVCRIALEFFKNNSIPFWEMTNENGLIGNAKNKKPEYCFARKGQLYLVYLGSGGSTKLDLSGAEGRFTVKWFNPRKGGALRDGSVREIKGGGNPSIGDPPGEANQDWLAVIRK